MPAQFNPDDIVARDRQNFLSDVRERLETVDGYINTLRHTRGRDVEMTREILREAHILVSMGESPGFPSMSLISSRLEDYVSSADPPIADHLDNIQVFQNILIDIVDQGIDPGNEANAGIIRCMPVRTSPDGDPAAACEINVLLVVPSRSMSLFITRSLSARGCQISAVQTAPEAFELATTMRPDLIISSAVLDTVSGADLLRALAVMSVNTDTRFALVTSFDRDHSELRNLSPDVPLLRLGDSFEVDLDQVTVGLGERQVKFA